MHNDPYIVRARRRRTAAWAAAILAVVVGCSLLSALLVASAVCT